MTDRLDDLLLSIGEEQNDRVILTRCTPIFSKSIRKRKKSAA